MLKPASAVSSVPHWSGAAPSSCVTNRKVSETWFDHITPIFPSSATSAAMSSALTVVSATGSSNGVTQVLSLDPVECVTHTFDRPSLSGAVYVAHSTPVESFAIVADSVGTVITTTG